MKKWETEGKAYGVIVIVHGAMEHSGRYNWLVQKWLSAGYHVIIGDLPGQGMTSRSNRGHINSFDEYLDTVETWVNEAYTFGLPVFMLGHSMGGLIVVKMLQSSEFNLAGVILSSPCFGTLVNPPKLLNSLSHVLNLVYPSYRRSAGITIDMATRNKEVIEFDLNDSLYVTTVSIRWYRELVKAMNDAFDFDEDFPDIPFLVMQAGDDKIVDRNLVREWFNYCPSSEKHYKEWPKLYHEIFNEPEREDVFQYAKTFVESRLRNIGYII